eukprot:12379950-Ditylum_brightwellii.AAC.2
MLDTESRLLLLDKFSGAVTNHTDLLNSHVWGFPAYFLDPTLQDGKRLPKWNPWKCHGQFLGWSNQHTSSVALIMNLYTRLISPQFHTVMDDWFTTIACMDNWDPVTNGDLPDLAVKWLSEHEIEQCQQTRWYKTGALLPVPSVPTEPIHDV